MKNSNTEKHNANSPALTGGTQHLQCACQRLCRSLESLSWNRAGSPRPNSRFKLARHKLAGDQLQHMPLKWRQHSNKAQTDSMQAAWSHDSTCASHALSKHTTQQSARHAAADNMYTTGSTSAQDTLDLHAGGPSLPVLHPTTTQVTQQCVGPLWLQLRMHQSGCWPTTRPQHPRALLHTWPIQPPQHHLAELQQSSTTE